jgi:glucose/arabinose dehydrogenase
MVIAPARVRFTVALATAATIVSSCIFGPGLAAAPDRVGADTSPATLLAAYERLPAAPDRPPFEAPRGELARSGELNVPRGFVAERLLPERGLDRPTSLAFAPDGSITVALQGGRIMSVDHATATMREVARGFSIPLGLLWIGDALYVSDDGTVWRLRGNERVAVVRGIPTAQHSTDGMAVGPDGKIYLGVGTTCNACREEDARSGSIVRFSPDGSGFEIFARGFRNPYDLAFHPRDGSLWATDNGRDDLGTEVPDELNLVQQGKHYGWPDCYGRGRGGSCSDTVRALLELEANSSSNGVAFYTGRSFPAEFTDNLFIAQWGSFRRTRGRKLVRAVPVKRGGEYQPVRVIDFATGFDSPLDVVVGPADGALYVIDYGRGTLYRIRWQG